MERYDRIKIIVFILAMMIAQQAWPYRMKGRIMTGKTPLPEIGVRYQFTTGRLLNKKRRSINLSGKGDNGVRWDY